MEMRNAEDPPLHKANPQGWGTRRRKTKSKSFLRVEDVPPDANGGHLRAKVRPPARPPAGKSKPTGQIPPANLRATRPGRPVQNAFVESFHGKLRDECLNASWFGNLFEARIKIAAWKEEYNDERPHSSLGYLAPREFARRVAALRSPTAPCAPQLGERNEVEVMSSGEFRVV